jgi:glucosamine--fructose-6-phosphate aminotransferase (isomerizing)
MCSIFGVLTSKGSDHPDDIIKYHIDRLFLLSESRGKEAAGIAVNTGEAIHVLKQPVSASRFIKTPDYSDLLQEQLSLKVPLAAIGHCRLVTSNNQDSDKNNQPIVKKGAVGVHDGIVVNAAELIGHYPDILSECKTDTEPLLGLLQYHREEKNSIISSAQETFSELHGAASIGVLFDSNDVLLLATNTGSLYACVNKSKDIFVFASEKTILQQLTSDKRISKYWTDSRIVHILPFSGCLIDLETFEQKEFPLSPNDPVNPIEERQISKAVPIIQMSSPIGREKRSFIQNSHTELQWDSDRIRRKISEQPRPDSSLKRCTKCILPETFPGITFDEQGVCNYCRDYQKIHVKGKDALEELIAPYRSNSGEPDCIVGFSGGRDSSYMLHYVKKVLKMNPIAFTYDWGMVTDLARRNQARVCGKLGVEQVIISADLAKKREYIRQNIEAWLKKPDLGMVPLLMAGDKQFYYYAHHLLEQTGAKIIFNGGNAFEKTEFKLGFCGIKEGDTRGKGILTGISRLNKIKLPLYYAKQYLLNPAYINSSLFDTLHAYYSSYLLPDVYVYFFQYIPWNEEEIVSLLRREYDWEIATDTNATWRIGDGTAAFYDYIYYTAAGFSEFDTFRSNQIREGLMTREEALELVNKENIPRYESLEWYARTVGFDLEEALDVIHSIPKMWNKSR